MQADEGGDPFWDPQFPDMEKDLADKLRRVAPLLSAEAVAELEAVHPRETDGVGYSANGCAAQNEGLDCCVDVLVVLAKENHAG